MDKRVNDRTPLHLHVILGHPELGMIPGVLCDISPDGASVETDWRLGRHTTVDLHIPERSSGLWIYPLRASVVHHHADRTGLHFESDRRTSARLSDVFRHHLAVPERPRHRAT